MKGLTNRSTGKYAGRAGQYKRPSCNTRTYKQIIFGNTLTFFNFLNITLFVLILLVGSYKNSLFMLTIIFNTVIGIVQEIRAKKIIDQAGDHDAGKNDRHPG